MSKRKNFKTIEKPKIEESYDYGEQVRRQIERCLEASSIEDPITRKNTHQACVFALGNLIPDDDRDPEFMAELNACTEIKKSWHYETFAGSRVGTPENPMCHNEPGDYDYDPNKPTVPYSPILIEVSVTNWHQYFRVIFNKFVALGVTVRRGSHGG